MKKHFFIIAVIVSGCLVWIPYHTVLIDSRATLSGKIIIALWGIYIHSMVLFAGWCFRVEFGKRPH